MKDGYFFRIRVFSIIDKYWDFQEKIKMICISFYFRKEDNFSKRYKSYSCAYKTNQTLC